MKCLICGEKIPKGASIEDAAFLAGKLEDGTPWIGYAFICTFKCFKKFKERIYKTVKGKELLFIP